MNTTKEQAFCDHNWKTVDDSFSHEFGTEIIVFERCEKCDLEREYKEAEET